MPEGTVQYIDEAQLDYIETVEAVLDRAKEGATCGALIIEFTGEELEAQFIGYQAESWEMIALLGMLLDEVRVEAIAANVIEQLIEAGELEHDE